MKLFLLFRLREHFEGIFFCSIQKHLDNYEAVDDLLFGSDSTDGLNGYFILKAFNERLPFKFIKEVNYNSLILLLKDPFYLKGLIQEWSIEEIEIPLKSETKDLINRQYLFR